MSEAADLQIAHIDSARMQLNVAAGKGNKQRLVPLSPRLLAELRTYWKQYRPTHYLFPGKTPDRPYAATSIQKAIKASAKQAGIKKNVTPHTLRHSYATATPLRCVPVGSGRRYLDDQSPARSREFRHNDGLSARTASPFGIDAKSHRLATGQATSRLETAEGQRPGGQQDKLTIAKILQAGAARYVKRYPSQAAPQVRSTLAKLSLCRTAALNGRRYRCGDCEHEYVIYNSCGDRHCRAPTGMDAGLVDVVVPSVPTGWTRAAS